MSYFLTSILTVKVTRYNVNGKIYSFSYLNFTGGGVVNINCMPIKFALGKGRTFYSNISNRIYK